MAGAVHRRSVSWAVALAVPLAALALTTGRADGGAGSSCQGVGPAPVTPGKTPILFVHGINSSSRTWAATQPPDGGTVTGTRESPLAYVVNSLGTGEVAGYTFDWSSASGKAGHVRWVTDPPSPSLGERLAQAISCVARNADHRVIIVAHSMGGLITQYASSRDPKDQNGNPTDIAAVFTLGTPYQGSWLASSAAGQGPDPSLNVATAAIGYLCSLTSQPSPYPSLKRHFKPNGPIAIAEGFLCHLVNERNDPGVAAMRLKPGPQNELPSRPAGLPWYPLAASVQGVWQPVWPLRIEESLNYVGDGVVSASSQLAGGSTPTLTCPVIKSSITEQVSFLDALLSPCFHISEPYNKTLLDTIISIIQAKHMIPTANPVPSTRSPTPTPTPSLPRHWKQLRTLTDPTSGDIQSIAVSPAGDMLATGTFDGSSYLWNMATGQLVATITQASPTGDDVHSLAFSPDGKTLALGFGRGVIELRDVATMATIATFNDNVGNGAVSSLAFSPDGTMLAAADLGGNGAYLWDVTTGSQLALLGTSIGAVTSVAFSPDGKILATGGDNGTVLWDVATRHPTATLGTSGSGPIISGTFSPDGSLLATGGFNGAVLWTVATQRQVAVLPSAAPQADTTSIAFSPDGTIIATTGANTSLWATATGLKIAAIPIKAGSVAFGPHGQTLATTSGNSVILWTPAS